MPIYNSDIPKSSSEKVKFNLTLNVLILLVFVIFLNFLCFDSQSLSSIYEPFSIAFMYYSFTTQFQSLCLCEFQATEIICIRFSSIFLVDGRN
jgi:hypothetical protein